MPTVTRYKADKISDTPRSDAITDGWEKARLCEELEREVATWKRRYNELCAGLIPDFKPAE